jgi:hypothetical protein
MTPPWRSLSPRHALASVGALAAAVLMQSWGNRLPAGLWVPTGLLALTAWLVHRRHFGSQLFARAVLWANLLLGTLIATSSRGSEESIATMLVAATGVSLLALGRDGVEADGAEGSGAFAPKAWRGTLLLAMVLGLADAQSLLLFGALDKYEHGLPKLACAAFIALGVFGLYRMRVWGVLVSLAANLVVGALALAGRLGLPEPLVVGLVATALVQLLLPTPIVLAMFRGARPGEGRLPRAGVAATTAVVVALMGVTAFCVATGVKLLPR